MISQCQARLHVVSTVVEAHLKLEEAITPRQFASITGGLTGLSVQYFLWIRLNLVFAPRQDEDLPTRQTKGRVMLSHFPASSLEVDTRIQHPRVPRAQIRNSYGALDLPSPRGLHI